jgi:hypothetical protein
VLLLLLLLLQIAPPAAPVAAPAPKSRKYGDDKYEEDKYEDEDKYEEGQADFCAAPHSLCCMSICDTACGFCLEACTCYALCWTA